MGYLLEINKLYTGFLSSHQKKLTIVAFDESQWRDVLQYHFQPQATKPDTPPKLKSLERVFKDCSGTPKLSKDFAQLIFNIFKIACKEFSISDDKQLTSLQAFCTTQLPELFKNNQLNKDVFYKELSQLMIEEKRQNEIDRYQPTLVKALVDHTEDIDTVTYVLKSRHLQYDQNTPAIEQLYEILLAVKNVDPSCPELCTVSNRYRLYAALREASNTKSYLKLREIAHSKGDNDTVKLLDDISNAPKRSVPYFGAPDDTDPLHQIVKPVYETVELKKISPRKIATKWVQRNQKSLVWSAGTFVIAALAFFIPASMSLFIIPGWVSLSMLHLMGMTTPATIVHGKVSPKNEDESKYLKAQQDADIEFEFTPEAIAKIWVEAYIPKAPNEDDAAYIKKRDDAYEKNIKAFLPFFNQLFDPKRSIDLLADDLKEHFFNPIIEGNKVKAPPIDNLITMLNFLIRKQPNNQAINTKWVQYRLIAAMRIVMKDPAYEYETGEFYKRLNTLQQNHKNNPQSNPDLGKLISYLRFIQDQGSDTPILDKMKAAIYGHHFSAGTDDTIFQLASRGKEEQKRPPLFSAEWVQANKTPILCALGIIAVTLIVAMVFFPPLTAMLGFIGVKTGALSITAGVGSMTTGTVMATIAAGLSPLAFIAAKYYNKKEIDNLEANLAETRELKHIETDMAKQLSTAPSRFTSLFDHSSKPKGPQANGTSSSWRSRFFNK